MEVVTLGTGKEAFFPMVLSQNPGLTCHRCYTDRLASRSLLPSQSKDYPHFTADTLNLPEHEGWLGSAFCKEERAAANLPSLGR